MKTKRNRLRRKTNYLIFCVVVLYFFVLPFMAEASGTIKIGVIGPMKMVLGEGVWFGATLASDEINANGGIDIGGIRRKLELVKADSNELASVIDAASAMERLLSVEKVDLVVGGVRSEAVLAMQEIMADYKKIFIDSGSAHPELTMRVGRDYDRYKYYFRVVSDAQAGIFSDFCFIEMAARKLREELEIQVPKVALLMEKAKYNDPRVEMCKKILPEMGMEIVGIWRPSPNANDVMAELSAIKKAGAEIIFVATSGNIQHVLSKQWGEQKIPAIMIGFLGVGSLSSHWKVTGGLCNYAAGTDDIAYVDATPSTKPFMDHFTQRFKRDPDRASLSYDAIYTWKDAVERSGSLDPELLVAALEKTDFLGVQGRICFQQKGHDSAHSVKVGPNFLTRFGYQWRDGEKIVVWPDGKKPHPVLAKDPIWAEIESIRYQGTSNFIFPPWMKK